MVADDNKVRGGQEQTLQNLCDRIQRELGSFESFSVKHALMQTDVKQ